MCGRTACTLGPDELCRACQYRERLTGKLRNAKWRDSPGVSETDHYRPSYNFSPGRYGPVLVSGAHFGEFEKADRVVQPMRWGLVPSWHKDDPSACQYKMSSARSEAILTKNAYRGAFKHGRRCVVLADGFYEWHKVNARSKQPYFIFFRQPCKVDFARSDSQQFGGGGDVNGGVKEKDESAKPETSSETVAEAAVAVGDAEDAFIDAWVPKYDADEEQEEVEEVPVEERRGRRLLTMAGVFDVNGRGAKTLYSYAVVTVDAPDTLSWMHGRMPAVLETDEDISRWLDFENVPADEAVKLLKAPTSLDYYKVSPAVGNVRNQGRDCLRPLQQVAKQQEAAAKRPRGQAALTSFFGPDAKKKKKQ